jgi:hypothetical protein
MTNNIKFVCVATETKLYLPYLKQLIPDLVILGLNTKWGGFFTKYRLFNEYLSNLNDDDIVCFLDAYDVLPTKNINTLYDKFISTIQKHPDTKMIVAYEKFNNVFIEDNIMQHFFGSVNGKRLNSGSYIGYVKNIKHILKYMIEKYNTNTSDDQVALTMYANEFSGEIYIDIDKDFFHADCNSSLSQIYINEKTNHTCIVHACGNSLMDEFLKTEHNIIVNYEDKIKYFIENAEGFYKKSMINISSVFK